LGGKEAANSPKVLRALENRGKEEIEKERENGNDLFSQMQQNEKYPSFC